MIRYPISYEILHTDVNVTKVEISYNDGTSEQKEYKTIAMLQIREWIKLGKDIVLDNAYVKDFIYSTINNGNSAVLKNFSAKDAFFDGEKDFSYAKFENAKMISFEKSFWTAGEIGFECAEFNGSFVTFDKSYFEDESKISFDGSVFNLSQNVTFDKVIFNNTSISLIGCLFNKSSISISRSIFAKGSLEIDDCTLTNIMINGTSFTGTDISISCIKIKEGIISFRNAKCIDSSVKINSVTEEDGSINFNKTSFDSCDISFDLCRLNNSEFDFMDASLNNADLEVYNCVFSKGNVLFAGTTFEFQETTFLNVTFDNNDITFGKHNRKSKVKYCLNDSTLKFDDSTFIGNDSRLLFDDCFTKQKSSSSICFKGCFFDKNINLSRVDVKNIIISDCINKDIIRVQPVDCTILDKIELYDVKNMGSVFLNWDNHKKALLNNTLNADVDIKTDFKLKAQEMKMLKENYHNQGQYDWEDEAYVQFKRFERKSSGNVWTKMGVLLDWLGGYGTKPLKVFLWMLGVVFIFGLLYWLPDCTDIVANPENYVFKLWHPFYYSMITFLTVGYGDFAAQNGITALLAGIEGFLGVFLMSYFSVSLVRKTLR